MADSDAMITDKAIEIKKYLSNARRKRNIIINRLATLNDNYNYQFSITKDNLKEIKEFFPDINLNKITEIETFHNEISNIFKQEIKQEKNNLLKQVSEYEELIKIFEKELNSLIQNPNISKLTLQRYSDLLKSIEKMEKENDSFLKLQNLETIKKTCEEGLQKIEKEQFAILALQINDKMKELNDFIYNSQYNAPVISFGNNSYTFFTPNDTGTGIAYKGLVVFDLSVLCLTKLPLIVHDSIILKQISDEAIEKILELYISCGKQVVIALDKQDSYTEKVSKILNDYAVLKLAPNGDELFGRSWG